ncbi:fluoride efflux transporter CrcB [Leptolyngbya sp. NIES-2104]|uniref:fluoride efflux transporter CrcB n=1 Tax=Leptolyngbya sp. NIES-2104 TaxID=1552121 RepID=UPI0006EC991E|nr:fluoride efflux transporter CrcB [Leptolyngbya sp. NIES-2104]GAP94783.1 CrcB protein [Leptolyngbya sp. NIES-2104]
MIARSPILLSFGIFGLLNSSDSMLSTSIAVSLGAIPGALSRYYLTVLLSRWLGDDFPYGTFSINLTGSLLMGFFATLAIEHFITSLELQLLITTGFLGSYTTFSTYALDTSVLLRGRNRAKALFYWLGSSILGGICLGIGVAFAKLLLWRTVS